MKEEIKFPVAEKVYHFLSVAFSLVVVLSNVISAKMVKFPGVDLSVPAGLLIYPISFLLRDLVNEFFGVGKTQFMIYSSLVVSLLGFAIIEVSLWLPTGVSDAQNAFKTVFELSGLRIFSSLTAYAIVQIVDVRIYALIKKWTGPQFLWLRSNGSTCLSQIIDTIAIDIIFLYCGLNMEMRLVLPIMIFSYAYKTLFSLAITPLFYFCVSILKKLLKRLSSPFGWPSGNFSVRVFRGLKGSG